MKPVLEPRGFAFLPLQTPWVRAFFHLPADELLREMRVITTSGHVRSEEQSEGGGEAFGGADAIVELAKHVWWARALVALAQIPGARKLLRAAYRAVASRRYCVNGRCAVARPAPGIPNHGEPESGEEGRAHDGTAKPTLRGHWSF